MAREDEPGWVSPGPAYPSLLSSLLPAPFPQTQLRPAGPGTVRTTGVAIRTGLRAQGSRRLPQVTQTWVSPAVHFRAEGSVLVWRLTGQQEKGPDGSQAWVGPIQCDLGA